ncbi:hypothetical protein C8F04DRAFT_1236310 [Mycena alexandri]|uniref:Uncharacterized protein n=1 Tax=Mycena alexandri TaxID=1745969 RepID=A0AAD6SMT4_9AGAR|nr:hypothetical protein C8F04DRAFT_1236310 [Mycena alexandri]
MSYSVGKPTLKTGSLCKGVFLRTTHPGSEGTDVVKVPELEEEDSQSRGDKDSGVTGKELFRLGGHSTAFWNFLHNSAALGLNSAYYFCSMVNVQPPRPFRMYFEFEMADR